MQYRKYSMEKGNDMKDTKVIKNFEEIYAKMSENASKGRHHSENIEVMEDYGEWRYLESISNSSFEMSSSRLYRAKRGYVLVNGIRIEKPIELSDLDEGDKVFYVNPLANSGYETFFFVGAPWQKVAVNRGICYWTEQGVIEHVEALGWKTI